MNFERFELSGSPEDRGRETTPDGSLTKAVAEDETEPTASSEPTTTSGRGFGREVLRYVVVFGMAIVISFLLAFDLATIVDNWAVWAGGFVIGLVALWPQHTTRGTVGTGLYVAALLILLLPVGQYAPSIFSSANGEGTLGPWTPLQGILGLVIGLIIAAVVALVVAAVGYAFNRWAQSATV